MFKQEPLNPPFMVNQQGVKATHRLHLIATHEMALADRYLANAIPGVRLSQLLFDQHLARYSE